MRPSVVLEVPGDWFQNPMDGERHRTMYATILTVLSQLEANVDLRPIPFGSDAAPRIARRDQLLLSFHSRGPEGNVLRIKESYIPPYYTMDPTGYSGFATLARDPDRYRAEFSYFDLDRARATLGGLREQFRDRQLSKYPQQWVEQIDLPSEFIFFPIQTLDDPVALFWRVDQLELLAAMAAEAARRDTPIVVKRHPLCNSKRVSRLLEKLATCNDNFFVSNASVHQLIDRASAVVGGNSGVMFEALVHGKPAYSLAVSDFEEATTPIGSLANLHRVFSRQQRRASDYRDRFLGWYLECYCVRADDPDGVGRRIREALDLMDLVAVPEQSVSQRLLRAYAEIEKHRRRVASNGNLSKEAE